MMQNNKENSENPNLFPIILHEGVHVVDSRLIAEALGVNHSDWFRNIILKYQEKIEAHFHHLRFENGDGNIVRPQGGGKQQRYVLLTEDQALYIGVLSKNTEQVVEFKAKLVASFAVLRQDFAKVWELYQELTQELHAQEEWQTDNFSAVENTLRALLDYCKRLDKTNMQLKELTEVLQKQVKMQRVETDALKQHLKAQDLRMQNLENGFSQLQTSQTTFGQRMEEFEQYLERVRKRLGIQAMCFVYILYSPVLKMYKIGWADDTELRQQKLQTANPFLEFVLAIPVVGRRSGKSLENTLHLQFDYCRHEKTEWFSLSESDLQYCQMLRILNEGKMEEMTTAK